MQIVHFAPPLPPAPEPVKRVRKLPPRRAVQETRQLLLDTARDGWTATMRLVAATGLTDSGVRRAMEPLVDSGRVQVMRRGRAFFFRTSREGEVPPLYETHLDARPLADAFGGYTYLKGEAPWHQ